MNGGCEWEGVNGDYEGVDVEDKCEGMCMKGKAMTAVARTLLDQHCRIKQGC